MLFSCMHFSSLAHKVDKNQTIEHHMTLKACSFSIFWLQTFYTHITIIEVEYIMFFKLCGFNCWTQQAILTDSATFTLSSWTEKKFPYLTFGRPPMKNGFSDAHDNAIKRVEDKVPGVLIMYEEYQVAIILFTFCTRQTGNKYSLRTKSARS